MEGIIKFFDDPKPYLLNTKTGFLEPAIITIAQKEDLKKIFKKDGWHFSWNKVPLSEIEVYKICLLKDFEIYSRINSCK